MSRSRRHGFTLTEILVSMSVLALLVVLISGLLSRAADASAMGRLRFDSEEEARSAFDRMAGDFSGMLRRKDLDAIFSKQSGNDKMFFYSSAPGYFSGDPAASVQSPYSLIGYRLEPPVGLERLGKGLSWSGPPKGTSAGAPVFLTYSSPGSAPDPESTLSGHWPQIIGTAPLFRGSDEDYHRVGAHIFRLEFCFQLRVASSSGALYANALPANRWEGVSAIVVAIAVRDRTNRPAGTSSTDLAALLGDCADANLQSIPPLLMDSVWRRQLDSSGNTADVRIFQRFFPLR